MKLSFTTDLDMFDVLDSQGLTRLPDTVWRGQRVADDALVPQASEPVDDAAALVQHRALHLVLVGVRAPVTRLGQERLSELTRPLSGASGVEAAGGRFTHLDEGYLAGADVALQVLDGDLAVVLQVTLLTQHVVDAGHDLVPLVVVTVSGQNTNVWQI